MTNLRSQTPNLSVEAKQGIIDLLQVNTDNSRVLKEAADQMKDPVIPERLNAIVDHLKDHEDVLRTFIAREDAANVSLCGTAHQMWVDLRAAINAGDTYVMLLEAEKAVDRIDAAYDKVLSSNVLPGQIANTIAEQFKSVSEDREKILELRQNFKQVRQSWATPSDHP